MSVFDGRWGAMKWCTESRGGVVHERPSVVALGSSCDERPPWQLPLCSVKLCWGWRNAAGCGEGASRPSKVQELASSSVFFQPLYTYLVCCCLLPAGSAGAQREAGPSDGAAAIQHGGGWHWRPLAEAACTYGGREGSPGRGSSSRGPMMGGLLCSSTARCLMWGGGEGQQVQLVGRGTSQV